MNEWNFLSASTFEVARTGPMYKRRVEHRGSPKKGYAAHFPMSLILVAGKAVMPGAKDPSHRSRRAGCRKCLRRNVCGRGEAVASTGSQAAVQDSVLKWTMSS